MSYRLPLFAGLVLLAPAFAGTNNTILVSAPRLDDLDLMDVAVAADVTVIDPATIEQSGAVSVPELLQSEANVLIRGQGGNASDGQLSMRGFGDNSQVRVLVLVDGHKANRPDMGMIDWQRLPVSSIERIEVIRGGQNVLYGNHALSGVVKITTKRGGDVGLELNTSVGSDGYYSGSASYGGSFGNTDYIAGLQHTSYDGYRDNSATEASTGYLTAGWYMNDMDTLTLRVSGGKSDVEFPGPLSYRQMRDDPTQSNNLGDEYSDARSGQATILYETERDWGAARMNAGASFINRDNAISGIYNENDLQGFSLAPRARFGDEDNFWMAGLDLFYDQLDQDNYLDENRSIVTSWADIDRITTAPYLFAQRTYSEKTILNGGVRLEYAGTDNDYVEYEASQLEEFLAPGIPNPDYKNPPDIDQDASYNDLVEKFGWAAELSLSRQLTESLGVWAGYDRVYRYPTLDEAAAYQGFPLSDPLNEDLDPEHGNNFEIGTTYKNRLWNISLTGFYLMLDDEIGYDAVRNLNRNIGSTRRYGTETEVAWKQDWYGASTRWTLVDARIDGGENNGNRVPLVPWAYGVTSAWIEPAARLRLTASYTFVSEQYQGNDEANDLRKMDAYGLVGLRANVALLDSLDFYCSVQNLFDENYAFSAYSSRYYPGSGRSFRAGMTWIY